MAAESGCWLDSQVAWSKETIPRKFQQWVLSNRKRLLVKQTPQEKKFGRAITLLQSVVGGKASRVLMFRKQKPFVIADGLVFYADFHINAFRLVVEIDGAQHHTAEGRERDEWRTRMLSAKNLQVLRFTNDYVDTHTPEELADDLIAALMKVPGRGNIKRTLSKGLRKWNRTRQSA